MNRILYTTGNGKFVEDQWTLPACEPNQITVNSVLTGICRSDIDMMQGNFGPLPVSMSGHEGLGKVVAIGSKITDVTVGQYVATRGEPAYADQYTVRQGEYVVVPAAEPKYIVEPVACGINVVFQNLETLKARSGKGQRLLLLGSGFLAWVVYSTIGLLGLDFDVTVVGSSHKNLWKHRLSPTYNGTYDVIIDLSSKNDVFEKLIYNENALIVIGTQKQVTTNFADMLWKSVTISFPSPRNPSFICSMEQAVKWIEKRNLIVDCFWTCGYDRDTEWQQAFSDGVNRTSDYSRGYIKWSE